MRVDIPQNDSQAIFILCSLNLIPIAQTFMGAKLDSGSKMKAAIFNELARRLG